MNHSTRKAKRHDSPNGNGRNGSGTSAAACWRCGGPLPDQTVAHWLSRGTGACDSCAGHLVTSTLLGDRRGWLREWEARLSTAIKAAGREHGAVDTGGR